LKSLSEFIFQIFIPPSPLFESHPNIRVYPSLLKLNVFTPPELQGNVLISEKFTASQSFIVLSLLPDARIYSSGLKQID